MGTAVDRIMGEEYYWGSCHGQNLPSHLVLDFPGGSDGKESA